jgi:hypothetical protein
MKKEELYNTDYLNIIKSLQRNPMQVGILFYIVGILIGIVAYIIHIQALNYLSFAITLFGIGFAFFALYLDIAKHISQRWLQYVIPLILILFYLYQRWVVPDFSFTVSDASDYYLSGINNILNKTDIEFFLPLTASVSSTGFLLFGHEYLLYYFVILYIFILPLIYFIGKELKFHYMLSLGLVCMIIFSPMSIWFSKTSFTESIWQVLLLIVVFHSLVLMRYKEISINNYSILALLLFVLPFSRGEAVLLSVYVFFLSLYHFWKFGILKVSLIILSSSIFLFLSVQYTVAIRPHYLLTWQFSRIIANITADDLTWLMYAFFVLLFGVMLVLNIIKKSFKTLPLPTIIIVFALLFKIIIAVIYTEKKHLNFIDIWFMNEYSFAVENFGIPIVAFALFGLILMHTKALKNHALLVLVVSYAIFSLPFIMQTTSYTDKHEFFLYWSRYYYSYLSVVYIFSIGIALQYFYENVGTYIKDIYHRKMTMLIFVITLTSISFNYKLNEIVRTESYLHNSSKLIDWIVKKVPNSSVSIVFPTNISYGNRDIKQLIRRSLKIHNIHVNHYYKVYAKTLSKTLSLPNRVYTSQYIICFSSKGCLIDKNKFKFIEQYNINIAWRKHELETDILKINTYLYENINF